MRRMEKDAACAGGGAGGPLSELHVGAGSRVRNSAVASRMTVPLWITVTCGITFLKTFKRSAVTQFGWHDCDINTRPMASTPG